MGGGLVLAGCGVVGSDGCGWVVFDAGWWCWFVVVGGGWWCWFVVVGGGWI